MSQCWIKKRGLSVHLQPPGKMPLAWFQVIQTVPAHLPKAWILCMQLFSLPHSLSAFDKLLSLSFCNSLSLYRAPVVQLHGRGQWFCSLTPTFKLSSPVSTHNSHRHSSSPSLPRRDGTVNRMLCCGEPAANGKRRREWEWGRKKKGGESSWKRMTSPVQRKNQRERGDGRWRELRKSKQGKLH